MSVMHDYVLVLNKGWTPVAAARMKDALVKLFNYAAHIVDESNYEPYNWEQWMENYSYDVGDISRDGQFKFIFSPKLKIRAPEIIVLTNYNHLPKRNLRLTRKNLLLRDNYTCQYTGKKLTADSATVDHIFPSSRGGKNSWDNVVISSEEANARKGDRTPQEANMRLLKKPSQPMWNPVYSVTDGRRLPSWDNFLGKK